MKRDLFSLNYKEILRYELKRRQEKNPAYSLRAFARDLNIPAPRISEVLNGKQGLSLESAKLIASRLHLNELECRYFVTSVEYHHARSKSQKATAEQSLKEFRNLNYKKLDLKIFELISSWEFTALLELTRVKNFKGTVPWISAALGIEKKHVRRCINVLEKVGLIKKQGTTYQRIINEGLKIPTGAPSSAIRSFHFSILEKAKNSLISKALDQRDFSCLVLAIDKSKLSEAKLVIEDFRKQFNQHFGNSAAPDSVYALSIQLSPLSEEIKA